MGSPGRLTPGNDRDGLTRCAVVVGATLAIVAILVVTSVAVFGMRGGHGAETSVGSLGGKSSGPTAADSATSASSSEARPTSTPAEGRTARTRMKCTILVSDDASLTDAVDAAGPDDVVCYRGGAHQQRGVGVTNRAVQVISGRGDTVKVTDAASLTSALSAAKPGQTIEMADGTYSGRFVINSAGQQGNPITLKGSRKAVLNGGDTGSGYTLHLSGADYWQLVGFSVTGGQKGIMADKTSHSVLSGLDVGDTGQEAVHLLNFSTSNVVQNSVIHDTGKGDPQFGEGLYFGTAKSNWAKKSGGKPDKSDNNKAIANTFRNTTAENIDVKEVIWGRGRELVTSVAAPSGRSGVSSVRLLAAGWGPGLGVGW